MSLYLDTSIVVPLQMPEPKSELLQSWLGEVSAPLLVSDLTIAEFSSVISRYERMAQISADAASMARANFGEWRGRATARVENLPVDIRVAARLVETPLPKLVTPDAIHIATCLRLGLTLVAHDGDMVEHATRLGVVCIVP